MTADWRPLAACRSHDPALWFPERGHDTRQAKAICAGCPVREQCLEQAIADGETVGIWGGLSGREMRQEKRRRAGEPLKRGPKTKPIKHGTAVGYVLHRRRGEQPCQSCREAHAAYQRERAA